MVADRSKSKCLDQTFYCLLYKCQTIIIQTLNCQSTLFIFSQTLFFKNRNLPPDRQGASLAQKQKGPFIPEVSGSTSFEIKGFQKYRTERKQLERKVRLKKEGTISEQFPLLLARIYFFSPYKLSSFHDQIKIKMSYYYPFMPFGGQMMPALPFWTVPAQSHPLQPVYITIPPPDAHGPSQKKPILSTLNTSTALPPLEDKEEKARKGKRKATPRKDSDQNFGWRNQNKDRNILSNILKAFVNHLADSKGLRNYLLQVFQKLDLNKDVSYFYEFVQENFPMNRSYISSRNVKAFLRDPSHPSTLILVFKLALQRFFKMDFKLVLLNSKKIKKRSKLEQMKKSRELLDSLFSK